MALSSCFLDRPRNGLGKLAPVAGQPRTVDEEGRCPVHSRALAVSDVLLNLRSICVVAERSFGCLRIQPERPGDLEQPLEREALPAGEQQRARVPELPLRARELRELRGEIGARVQLRIREM